VSNCTQFTQKCSWCKARTPNSASDLKLSQLLTPNITAFDTHYDSRSWIMGKEEEEEERTTTFVEVVVYKASFPATPLFYVHWTQNRQEEVLLFCRRVDPMTGLTNLTDWPDWLTWRVKI
jgi:hypothetical protein